MPSGHRDGALIGIDGRAHRPVGVVESGSGGPHGDAEPFGDLRWGQAQVMREHEHRPLVRRQPSEAAFDAVAIVQGQRLVRARRSVDRENADVGDPRIRAACLGVARVDEQPLEPGVEAVRIAETGQLTPGDHQRLLYGVLGPSDIPKDPLGDRHEPVAMRPGQDGKGLPVATLRLLNEIAIQQIALRGVRRGRLPTLLSGGACRAFDLRFRERHQARRFVTNSRRIRGWIATMRSTSSGSAGRSVAGARALAAGLWIVAAVGGSAIVIFAVVGAKPAAADFWPALVMFAFIAIDAVTCTSVGALIAIRRPGNLVGWLLAAVGAGLALTFAGFGLAGVRTSGAGPTDLIAGLAIWTGVVAFNPTIALVGFVMLVFPDGRLPSTRWARPTGALIFAIVIGTLVIAIKPDSFGLSLPVNPFGLDHALVRALAPFALAAATGGALGSIVLGAVAVGVRFVRAGGDTREQMKWFLGAVAIVALTTVPGIVFGTTPMSATTDSGSQAFGLFDVIGAASLALVPIAIGVAVLRYRLYDIDRLISRTVGWALSTVVLLAVFGTGIVAVQTVLVGVTQGETLAVAVSTLVAFALFQPVHRRIQRAVDRRFDRARYDAGRVIEGFSERLRDELDLGTLSTEVMRVASDAVRPTSATIWLRRGIGAERQGR